MDELQRKYQEYINQYKLITRKWKKEQDIYIEKFKEMGYSKYRSIYLLGQFHKKLNGFKFVNEHLFDELDHKACDVNIVSDQFVPMSKRLKQLILLPENILVKCFGQELAPVARFMIDRYAK